MIEYHSNDSYQMIEEASILGLKINKKKLQDEEYIRKLLDKIQQMEDTKDTINTIIVVLSIISMLTVVGLPIGLLLFEISKKIDKNKEKISNKNKEKINSYIDKSIDKLKKSASKASGDEKEKLEKIISNLEKNKNIIHTNNKIIQFTDEDKFTRPVALDFKKHLENKLKSTGIEVGIGDEDTVYFKYDDFDDTMLASGQESEYYHEKSKQIANAIMSYNKNVLCDKNDNNFTIDKRIEYNNTIIDLSYKEDRFNCFVLPVVSKDMIPNTYTYSQVKTLLKDINIFGTTFYDNKIVIDVHTKNVDTYMKKISSIFKNATISTPERKFKVGQGEIINIEFNSSIKESYTPERGEIDMDNIIQEGLFNKNPYKDIIKEYKKETISIKNTKKYYKNIESKILSSLKSQLKSIKDIELYAEKNTDDWDDNDGFIVIKVPYDFNLVKQTSEKVSQYKLPKSFYNKEKLQLIGIMDNTIISVTDADVWDDESANSYVNQIDIGIIYTKEEADKTGISVDTVFDILNKVDGGILNKTAGYIVISTKLEENKCKNIIKSIRYNTYYNKGKIYIFNPKVKIDESYTPERGEIKMNSINSLATIAKMNELEPTRNRLRLDIVSEYTDIIDSLSTIEESIITNDISLLPVYKIEEGNAIDLDSLKYVVESKKITLDKAIQEFKNINSIEEDASFYCVLPENINENITVESFITLNNTLSKANIIPISNKSINLEDFTIKPQV